MGIYETNKEVWWSSLIHEHFDFSQTYHNISHTVNFRTKESPAPFTFYVNSFIFAFEKANDMNTMILLAAVPATEEELSVWDMILKGGWLMIPIFILSVIAVYIFCERYVLIRRYARKNDRFMDKIRECLFAGNLKGAISLCNAENTPMSRMLIKGILHFQLPIPELRAVVESSANLEVSRMEKGLSTLATCAGMAPMIGFLGTVVGMVQAFYDMALAGNNINITLLSRGIYTAMITTVAGLIVGIIAYFAYNALTARIDKVVNNMESTNADFMETIYELKAQNKH